MASVTILDFTELHLKTVDDLELYRIEIEAMMDRCMQKRRLRAYELMKRLLQYVELELKDRRNIGL